MRPGIIAAAIGATVLMAQAVAAQAAEVKVLGAYPLKPMIDELGPQFERATGHTLAIQYGLPAVLKRQIEAGETFDLAILGAPGMDDLIKQGKIVAGTRTDIARDGMGVAVRAGAPKPDISSAEAFKRTLLNAKSISYVKEGATGVHLANLLERFGIAEEMKSKTKLHDSPARAIQAVADGEAELGFVLITLILPVRGAEVAGPFPPELQRYVVFTAGVSTGAKQAEAAKALANLLTSESAAPVIKAKGMEPAAR
jgi:molybdate transport system substrate-binding protein